MEKPPIGLRPKSIHERDRAIEILQAIERYVIAGVKVPAHWISELKEIVVEV